MIRRKSKVNVVLLAALSIIVSGLTITEATIGYLPPEFAERSSSRIAEKEAGIDYNARADINYRLPNNTEPIHYDIELTTNVHNGTKNFTGKVQISLTVTEDTRTIVMHARQLDGFQASITNGSGFEYALEHSYEKDREFLQLTPQLESLNFNKGTNWTLSITYKGVLRTDGAGFHILSYTDANNKQQ